MKNNKQKILIVGSGGGREHAMGWKITQSPRAGELFFAKGNAGTAELGTNLDIKETDTEKLLYFSKVEKVDLVLVVSDDPLAAGLVDEFKKVGLRVWGPTKRASELEWSKVYAKDFMKRHNIPTARYETFTDLEKATLYVGAGTCPIVIKASGLALGKGVTIAETKEEAKEILRKIFVDKIFGDAGREVVIEEYLSGIEISIHAISDGKNWKLLPSSQDHKRIFDGNQGPNTGGMGVIAPLPFVGVELMKQIEKEIIAPAIRGIAKDGRPFVGCLYPGIMLTKDGPKVFEFNARFGDPETQTYMRLLETDFLDIVDASIDENLDTLELKWKPDFACNIALASGGYPGAYEKEKVISGIKDAEKNPSVIVFHAGTKMKDGTLVTNGGRVLGVSAVGNSLKLALDTAYEAISKISFEGMQYRKDIGQSALKVL
ncbi:MAG: phosphoribosylamine--glycine ligase [bacterium]|nr:phosphoribosylamine--glycine ligase [bacterium]